MLEKYKLKAKQENAVFQAIRVHFHGPILKTVHFPLSFLIYVSQEGYSTLGTSYLPIRVLLTHPANSSVFGQKIIMSQHYQKAFLNLPV